MPSHRADTPPDVPVAVLDRPTQHTTRASARTARPPATAHAPMPRRRDLRAARTADVQHAPAPLAERAPARVADSPSGALDWLDIPASSAPAVPAPRQETPQQARQELSWDAPTTIGPLALDPLFLQPAPATAAAGDESGSLTAVQPLRRPRGKQRAQAQTTRRAVQAAAPAPSTRRGVTAPQAGIAGALGLATIAVPLCSALGVVPAAQAGESRTTAALPVAVTALPPFPMVAQPSLNALADRRLLPDETPVADVPAALAAPRVRLTVNGRASRGTDRQLLPGCTGKVGTMDGVQNGRLPASILCTLWDRKFQLRADAAVAMAKLNVSYTKRFGHPICFNDAYRSLAEQYAIKARRGSYAARPGTSEHGWGLAVDLCDGVDQGPGSATYAWLRANAPAYGWENPLWARSGGSGPYEPWHWEYMPGERAQSNGD